MSIFFNNRVGQRLVDDMHVIPEFLGKVVLNPTPFINDQGSEPGYLTYAFSGPLPALTTGKSCMIYWTLPVSSQDIWWWASDLFLEPGHFGGTSGITAVAAVLPSALPEGYVFSLEPLQMSNVNPAARLWAANGDLLFDSGKLQLALQQVVSGVTVTAAEANLSISNLPAKPAFFLPEVVRHREMHDYLAEYARITSWLGSYRRKTSGVLTSRLVQVSDLEVVASREGGYFEDAIYGNSTGLILPVINAALYD